MDAAAQHTPREGGNGQHVCFRGGGPAGAGAKDVYGCVRERGSYGHGSGRRSRIGHKRLLSVWRC